MLCLLVPLSSLTLAKTDLFTVSIVLHILEHNIVRITQYITFSDCLLSLSNTHSLNKEHLSYFEVLEIMNEADINICVQVLSIRVNTMAMTVSVASHPHQNLVLSVFWILAILVGTLFEFSVG